MPLRLVELQDRFRAAVLGFAIGDALGFPLRGLPPPALRHQHALGEDFASRPRGGFPKGQFSDDTQMMLAVADAVAREQRVDGRAAAQHLMWLWQEGTILQPPLAATQAAEALLGGTPWMSAGAPLGVCDASSLSRGVVVGLFSEESPPRLAHDAQVLTVVTHKEPLCAAAVAAVGRAIQLGLAGEPLSMQAWCDQVSQAAAPHSPALADELFYLPRAFSWDTERALAALRRVGVPASQYDFEAGLPSHVTPVLLTALYAVLKCPGDFRGALSLVLGCGGEVDVAAGVTGAVLGAALGTDAMPARLKKNVMYAEHLVEAADALFDAKLAKSPAYVTATVQARR
ncbi:MAG: ADP-ribosylglycohydrolase family protein [Myxococcota bacterium]